MFWKIIRTKTGVPAQRAEVVKYVDVYNGVKPLVPAQPAEHWSTKFVSQPPVDH